MFVNYEAFLNNKQKTHYITAIFRVTYLGLGRCTRRETLLYETITFNLSNSAHTRNNFFPCTQYKERNIHLLILHFVRINKVDKGTKFQKIFGS